MTNYGKTKEERMQQAIKHNNEMLAKYNDEINKSILESVIYSFDIKSKFINKYTKTHVILEKMTTTDAIFKHKEQQTAALNFASYTRPGGGFIKGSMAQEEALCHDSTLYQVLVNFTPVYDANYFRNEGPFYKDWGIYSPDIVFIKNNETTKCDIITCAAPNLKNAKDKNISLSAYSNIMKNRIRYVLNIADSNNVDTLILGAFGCGVFGNDATFVAQCFKDELKNFSFNKVIFAIPDDFNYNKFAKVF